jgi:hypothetical protein
VSSLISSKGKPLSSTIGLSLHFNSFSTALVLWLTHQLCTLQLPESYTMKRAMTFN